MGIRHTHRITTIATSLAALGSLASCLADEELDTLELSDDSALRQATFAVDDPLPQSVLDEINAALPEDVDATVANPELFPVGFDPNPEVVLMTPLAAGPIEDLLSDFPYGHCSMFGSLRREAS